MADDRPFAEVFRVMDKNDEDDDDSAKHALSTAAQVANLQAAWAHYSAVKHFVPGQLLKGRTGLGIMKKDPIMLYVRALDWSVGQDRHIIQQCHDNQRWNKLDCIVTFVTDDAQVLFMPMDSDLLEDAFE
jgi:hypothetical protein